MALHPDILFGTIYLASSMTMSGQVKSGQVNIIYAPTTDNLEDFLTKAIPAIKLCGNKIKLNMIICG